jgi:hypothetical protein
VQNDTYVAICPTAGNWHIPVRNGKAAVGFERFDEFTIENLFNQTRACALPMPFYSCSIEYDSNYGYPTRLVVHNDLGTEQCTSIRVLDVQIDR